MKSGRTLTKAVGAVLLCALLSVGAAARAYGQTGGAAVIFLMIEPDSRAAGMGNAGVAVADNAYATFWNPAGLAFERGGEVSITHTKWLPEFDAGLYYENLAGKYHIDGAGTLGGQIIFLNLGENECRDQNNQECGVFRSYDLASGLSYGFNVGKNLAIGTGARIIYSSLAQTAGQENLNAKPGVSFGIDAAMLYRSNPFSLGNVNTTVSAGFNLSNMGPKIKYTDTDSSKGDPIPTNIRAGYAVTFDFDQYNTLTFANDFTKMLTHTRVDSSGGELVAESDPFYRAIFSSWSPIEVDMNAGTSSDPEIRRLGVLDQLMIGMGLEYWYNHQFAARAGYFYENPYNGNRKFLTFGAGVRYSIVGVDFSYIYALEENSPLANTLRFSLLLNFNK